MQGDEFINDITNNLKTDLIESTAESEYEETRKIEEGLEDQTRRKEVDSNYNKLFYYNSESGAKAKLFEQIENEYTYNESLAKELSDNTYMIVYGATYKIDKSGGNQEYKYLIGDEEDYDSPEDYKYHIVRHIDVEYTGCDLGLTRRPALDLKLGITITGLRATSHDMLLHEDKESAGSKDPVKWEADDELLWGTAIDIEYAIEISNVSSLQCNYLNVIAYVPKAFGFDENIKFITADGTNKVHKWKKYDISQLKDEGFISNETYNKHKNQIAVVATIDHSETPDFYIPSGGSRIIKLVISSVSSGELDMYDETHFNEIEAEILGYKDNGENTHRRMATLGTKMISSNNEIAALQGLFPGNNKEHDYCAETTNFLYIGPPMGKELNLKIGFIIFAICVTPLIIFEVVILLKKVREKARNLT